MLVPMIVAAVVLGLVAVPASATAALRPECKLPTCVTLPNEFGGVEGLLSESGAFVAFKGIPFAKPPLGVLRWAAPQPAQPWGPDGVAQAKTFKPNCAQSAAGGPAWSTLADTFSEDCLYLNVWMPWSEQEVLPEMPVCLYIHGGGYAYGGANDRELDGAFFAEIGDCIMVTIQYRLGVFGFLGHSMFRSDTDNSTGNWGIQDQRLAIKWVHDNIKAFNGNASQIMIFGESAGAAGVSNHVAMPRSWPFFSQAAMQSGGFQEWAAKSLAHAEANFDMFVRKMDCATGSPSAVRMCLQSAQAATIIDRSTRFVYPHDDSWDACRWAPVIDSVELAQHPNELLKLGRVHPSASLVLGTNADEGTDFIGYNHTGTLPHSLPANLSRAGFIAWATAQFGTAAATKLLELFPVPSAHYSTYWKAAQRVVGLYMMSCPNRRFARYHATHRPNSTYVYYFAELPGTIPTRRGVFHGADIRFVFFNPIDLVGWDEKDLSLNMLRYWTNLAASGNPNLRNREQRLRPLWPAIKSGSPNATAIHFEAAGVTAIDDVFHVECNFFDTLPTQT